MLKTLAISKALRRPAPRSIPLSGPRAAKNNFYATYVEVPEFQWKLLVDSEISGKGYTGLLWINEKDGRECTILHQTLRTSGAIVVIEHYYRGNQLNYVSPAWFLIAQAIRRHDLSIFRNRILQRVYNRRTFLREDRLELLRYLVEEAIQTPGKHFDPLFLGMHMHTNRWFYHPQREEHHAYLKLVLESLCTTGELSKDNGSFVITPKALATLSNYEHEKQKHQDNLNTSRVGHRISGAILFVGLLAILVRVLIWWYGGAK